MLRFAGETMGTSWTVQAVLAGGVDGPRLASEIAAELARIDGLLSHWKADTPLAGFNRAPAGAWQDLPPELSRVLAAGEAVAEASGGAFDPAIGRLADVWGFGPAGRQPEPTAEQVAQAREGHIEHEPALLRARRFGAAALDFSGIGKGYAVDAVAMRLRALGLTDFLAEVGGEFVGEGVRPDGQPWWVDLEPVPDATGVESLRIALHGLAVATTGDYRRFRIERARRLSHTLDPRTARPLDNGVASVSVIHRECMWADAWATALTVLGPDEGLALAAREGLPVQWLVRGEGSALDETLSPAMAAMLED